jgi:hypothetical protein
VVVYAPETGSLTVRTTAHYVVGATAQPFSWAWTDAPPTAYRGGALAYGDGCPGTGQGPAVCTGTNTNGGELAGELGPNGLSGGNLYAYDQFTTTPLLVTSFEVFSASNTGGPVTVYAAIHGSVGGFIDLSPLATTTVTIGSAPGFYRATFAAPVAMPVGQFWTTVNHYRTSFVSQLTGGSQTGAFYRGSLGSLWERTTTVRRPAVRVICDSGPGAVPALAISGGYQLGHQVDYQLSLAAPNSAALRALGFSNSTSVFGALPLSLSGLGAPGCSLLTSAESVLFTPTDGAGQASGGLFLPNITGLLGAHVFGQYLVLDATVNPLGIATSNGLNFSIGQ